MLSLNLEGIPALLRGMPNFVVCQEEVRDGKLTKVPYLAPRVRAKTDAPSTWLTLPTALRQMKAGNFQGLGFCRSGTLRFGDFDGCLDDDESILVWDWGIEELRLQPGPLLDLLGDYSYIEHSMHASGLHAIFFADEEIPGGRLDAPGEHRGVEFYTITNRYLWLTGHRRSLGKKFGEDASVALREAIAWMEDTRARALKKAQEARAQARAEANRAQNQPVAQQSPLPKPQPQLVVVPDATPLSDNELFALAAKKGHHKLRAVLEGATAAIERQDMSYSGFEFAAAQCLCFYLGPDAARIDGFMRRIPGFSEREAKWDSRRPGGTYGSETIQNAIATVSSRYQRPRPPGRPPGTGAEARGEGPRSERPPAIDGFAWTDIGNASRFRLRFGEQLRHAGALKSWLHWGAEPCWKLDAAGHANQLAIAQAESLTEAAKAADDSALVKFSLQSQSSGKVESMLSLAKFLEGIMIDVEDLDRDPWLLNNQNGTLPIERKENSMPGLREHRREDYITQICACNYVPGAKHPAWDRFLETALPDPETRAFLQKAAGYTLTGSTREECCFLLVGEGRNGKGTFLHVMQTMLNDYATTASFETFLLSRRDMSAELASFRGKRMVVAQEAGVRATFNEAILKNLTGGDRIKARGLYQNPFEYLPQFKLWLAMNHLPEVRDASPGFWQRIRVIRFPVSFAGIEDQNLKTELTRPEVLEAVLAWAIEGCMRWQEEGLGTTALIETATAQYRDETDSVRLWLDERCEDHKGLTIQSSIAYTDYSDFCKTQNIYPASRAAFKNSLEAKGFPSKKTNVFFFMGFQLKAQPR